MAVAAKGRGDEIVFVQCSANAGSRRLLALALVDRAGHRAFQEQELHPFLKFADKHHALIQAQKKAAVVLAKTDRLASRSAFRHTIAGKHAATLSLCGDG